MCGICGVVSLGTTSPPVDRMMLEQMNATLEHRGPDDSGHYLDRNAGLAMRRLSIIDLSTGHQPIANEDKTIWTVFNGEIYNFREVRQRLEQKGHVFATKTDTEVIVHAYEEYGDECVNHFNGMFGLAVWDSRRKRFLLARDRLGIKPLYYHISEDRLFFGSELKAVIAHPDVPRELDLVAIDQFLTLEYIPTPRTIFKDIQKLPAGHRLILQDGHYHVEQYWNVSFHGRQDCDEATCVERLTELMRDAVEIRLVADVPLGAFLSGGIDSSSIVSFMSDVLDIPVRTFSVGFEDATYNELPYARLVSNRYNTQHHEEMVQPNIADLAEHLVGHLDEPFGDFSIFPTYLVSKVARKHVKVVLSGDGGDEIFAGYESYVAQSLARRFYEPLPAPLSQKILPRLMEVIPPRPEKKGLINKAKRFVEGGVLPASLQHTRWMMFMSSAEKLQLYRPELWSELNGDTPTELMERHFQQVGGEGHLAQQQYVDVKTYLVDDILTKVDRMSMAVSLETRVPFLDHRVVEFALNLPPALKLNRGETKVILRKTMANRLPSQVLKKPKQGFSIPLKHWLRSELRPLLTDLLAKETVKRRGYFEHDVVGRWVGEHLDGRANHSHRLWALMVFELWHRQVLEKNISLTNRVR